jgi:hypothetical protein
MGVRARGTDSVRIIQVIETRSLRGDGTQEDPCREVAQYWSFDGELLAEQDGISHTYSSEIMKGSVS